MSKILKHGQVKSILFNPLIKTIMTSENNKAYCNEPFHEQCCEIFKIIAINPRAKTIQGFSATLYLSMVEKGVGGDAIKQLFYIVAQCKPVDPSFVQQTRENRGETCPFQQTCMAVSDDALAQLKQLYLTHFLEPLTKSSVAR